MRNTKDNTTGSRRKYKHITDSTPLFLFCCIAFNLAIHSSLKIEAAAFEISLDLDCFRGLSGRISEKPDGGLSRQFITQKLQRRRKL